MTDVPESPADSEAARKRIVRSRNRILAVLLVGFAVLTFAISIVKMS